MEQDILVTLAINRTRFVSDAKTTGFTYGPRKKVINTKCIHSFPGIEE